MRRNASAGKIIFDRAELETLDASSMSELLSKLPGTGMSADMDSGPRGRPRGPDRNMPQILVDGQPLDAHLVVHAPQVLAPAHDAGLDVVGAKQLV